MSESEILHVSGQCILHLRQGDAFCLELSNGAGNPSAFFFPDVFLTLRRDNVFLFQDSERPAKKLLDDEYLADMIVRRILKPTSGKVGDSMGIFYV